LVAAVPVTIHPVVAAWPAIQSKPHSSYISPIDRSSLDIRCVVWRKLLLSCYRPWIDMRAGNRNRNNSRLLRMNDTAIAKIESKK